jgi:HK97 gp10 family phage protein
MAKVTMRLEGFETLQRALARAPDLVAALSSDAVQASSFAVAQRARALVPVASGDLRAAIESTSSGTNGRVGLVALGGPLGPTRYWRFVEFGTARHPARPFFRPAADIESQLFINRMRAIGPRLERDLTAGRFL